FDGLVERYDPLNRLLSMGLDRRWRRAAAGAVRVGPGERVLDLGCGTGDLSTEILRASPGALVVGVDLSRPMLGRARARVRRAGFVQGSAFALPFAPGSF